MNDRLKTLRKYLKLNQTDFAKKIGLTQSAIARLERGETALTQKQIKPICSVYGVRESWLVDGKGTMFVDNAVLTLIEEESKKLNETNQKYILDLIKSMLNNQNSDDGG